MKYVLKRGHLSRIHTYTHTHIISPSCGAFSFFALVSPPPLLPRLLTFIFHPHCLYYNLITCSDMFFVLCFFWRDLYCWKCDCAWVLNVVKRGGEGVCLLRSLHFPCWRSHVHKWTTSPIIPGGFFCFLFFADRILDPFISSCLCLKCFYSWVTAAADLWLS